MKTPPSDPLGIPTAILVLTWPSASPVIVYALDSLTLLSRVATRLQAQLLTPRICGPLTLCRQTLLPSCLTDSVLRGREKLAGPRVGGSPSLPQSHTCLLGSTLDRGGAAI